MALNYDSEDYKILSYLYSRYESYGRITTTIEEIQSVGWNRTHMHYLDSLGYITLTTTDVDLNDLGMRCYLESFDLFMLSIN